MGFPIVGASNAGNSGANVTQNALTVPSHSAGDRMLALFASDSADAVSIGASSGLWTNFFSGISTTVCRLNFFYRDVAASGETLRIDTATAQGASWILYRINKGTFDPATAPAIGTISTGASANPDPPSLTSPWGAEDILWIPVYSWDVGSAHSAYPANYSSNQQSSVWADAGGEGIAAATRELNASSENPGTGTIAASRVWIAQTIAIRPALPIASLALWADRQMRRNSSLRR